jgi:hypothetical protein
MIFDRAPGRAGFVAAALLLASCGGGGGGVAADASAPPLTSPESLRTAQPGEMLAYFKSRLLQRDPVMAGAASASPTPPSALSDFSGTPLQEAGVDEDDLLKSDGISLFALHPAYAAGVEPAPARLEARRIQPDGSLAAGASTELDSTFDATGMYLVNGSQRLAVLGQKNWSQVAVDLYDTAGAGAPVHAKQLVMDGRTISTRMIGNVLYLATTWSPDLSAYWVTPGTPADQAQAKLSTLTVGDLVPTIRIDGGPAQPLVSEQDCHLQPASVSLSLQITTLTAIDLSTPGLERRSRCFIGDGSTLYMSPSAAYIATSRNYWIASNRSLVPPPDEVSTDIHKFVLNGLDVSYRGSGEVTGHLGWDIEKMPFRFSEHAGHLRVVTFTGSMGWIGIPAMPASLAAATSSTTPPSPAKLTVLREDPAAGRLATVATLPNAQRPAPLGHDGEQVYAVHFSGPLAYVVTFRRTDPLYVLDLSNALDPKTVGELAMPGFSEYLFPLENGKLLGVGKDATDDGFVRGLKVALFDVSEPSQPALLASLSVGERGTMSALDRSRHGINIRQEGGQARVALPVRIVTSSSGVPERQGLARYVVDTVAGTLTERSMVETGFDPSNADSFTKYDLAFERAMQTAGATYYLSGRQLTHIAEP